MNGRHQHRSNKTCEWAALAALGALNPEESAAYQEHLADGCLVCEGDVRSFEEAAGQLGFAAAAAAPSADLRARLLQRIQAETEQPGANAEPARGPERAILFDEGGLLIARSTEMDWEAAPLPGISSRVLFNDPKRQYTTQLVRMEPNTTYPSHRHSEVEELYLLEGDLLVEGQTMRPGDYCRAEPDSIHGQVGTKSGALFLVLSSQQDEVLA